MPRRLGHVAKLPLASRSSTIGRPRSVPRTRTKAAVTLFAPVTVSVPVSVRRTIRPRVTSTVVLYGTCPPVNGAPFTVTVPVAVAVAGGAAPPDGVVVVVPPPPPPPGGAPASGYEATKLARRLPPALVKLPPAWSFPSNGISASTVALIAPFPAPSEPSVDHDVPSNATRLSASGLPS